MGGPDRPESLSAAGRRVVEAGRSVDVGLAAAALAYYGLVSLVPAVVLLATFATAVWGERVADSLLAVAGDSLSPSGERLLRQSITETTGRWRVSLGSALVLLWGLLRLFRGLDAAVGRVYGTESTVGGRFVDGVAAMVGVAGAVTVVLGARALALLTGTRLVGPAVVLSRVAVVALLLFPLYYALPNVETSARDALPGTVLAAGGWELLRVAFDLYLAVGGRTLGGLLGAVVLFVTWLFFGSALVVVGALVNAVVAGHR
ncbi:YhjD/YihY/BrkB family envelope integrity protein [Haloarcula litorea]|uniref:YhjD/YihY/BrkB family envelope integrity protein n=1 Tax=Haloarcula litorea TaxID=3032579 RepID=UPI0023E7F77E|nr:YhjD/YihY/BrkB family envelope integrity protein [Halomicroarcula sp. GDY20]